METILVGLIPGLAISVIGFFIVKTLRDIEGRIGKNEIALDEMEEKVEQSEKAVFNKVERVEKDINKKVTELSKELADHKETVQKDFVTKLDFARTYGEISKKLDKITDYIMQLIKER